MNSYVTRYTNKSFRLEFRDDEFSPRLRLIDDTEYPCSFNIAFASVDNKDLDKIRKALMFAATAFNVAFESQLEEITEQEKQLTLEEMSLEEFDF